MIFNDVARKIKFVEFWKLEKQKKKKQYLYYKASRTLNNKYIVIIVINDCNITNFHIIIFY